MDSTAYPHILERIIQQCPAVSTLLALRATSRRCRDVADATLFHHAVLRREWHQPKPKGKLRKLLRRITAPELTAMRRFVMVLPAGSSIAQDVPMLPFLPRKAEILDLEGARPGKRATHNFLDNGGPAWMSQEQELSTIPFGAYLHYATLVLRRIGRSAQEDWGHVRDTTVDFLALPSDPERDPWRCLRIRLPLVTRRYVLHLHWPDGCDAPAHDLFYFTGRRFRQWPAVREAVLVLSPHCSPPRRERVLEAIERIANQFGSSMCEAVTSLTVVGLEVWLPGVTFAEFKPGLTDYLVDNMDRRFPYTGSVADPTQLRTACEGIVFNTLEEWWDSLGDMKDLVGVWPRHSRRAL
ncbi:uncharacterized protein LOC62_04G005275 [Vanrija pseudolonga]|uniref:F-box domain-containing protein n=1 Tax=Vanrija pseudolonga TaxID=143232 RepID=A0AAF0YBJ0_9TREE|nr:hypothetical protein LOC62_04G005275 [Vanrija pseudolonga]